MKKIIAITAMVAAAAGIAFAADVSAATKINGNVMSYDGAKESFSLLKEGNDSHDYANPNLVFSIEGEKAGATIKLTTDGSNLNVAQTTQTIWFKPIDLFKVSVGKYDIALNKEQIDWTESETGLGGNGFVFSVNTSGFGLDVMFNEGDFNQWFTKDKDTDALIKEFAVKASYGADFGTVGAFFDYTGKTKDEDAVAATDATYGWVDGDDDPSTIPTWGVVSPAKAATEATYKDAEMKFGAGYRNNFAGVDVFGQVVGKVIGSKFTYIRPELYASGSAGDLGYSAFVAPKIYTDGSDTDPEVELVAKLTYKVGEVTPYVYFKDKNLLAKKFTSTVKAGVNGNLDGMGWNVWLQLDTGKGADQNKVNVSVPFELTISF